MKITERPFRAADRDALVQAGLHPVLARVYAARQIRSAAELAYDPANLLPPALLKGVQEGARLLAQAIRDGKRLLIVADYDADGATACAVGMRALTAFGANVDFLVPDRFKLGYGLTPELVELAARTQGGAKPDLLITVDNGIASVEGVAHARKLGIGTLITDHHLPGPVLPEAECIINPNQPGCGFPSKALAGVGVMFYLMLALRAEMGKQKDFNLGKLTDLVALGTVADVVPLDANNRNLVAQGLKRIRAGKAQPGIAALLRAAGRDPARATAFDFGFVAGPRLNAAGRLSDMSLGIECLLADDEARAANLAQQLDKLNRERRKIEAGMLETAVQEIKHLGSEEKITYFSPTWHEGVVGILASRLKDRLHRPVICFARAQDGKMLKGSGRSIAGFHLRDCLDLVSKRAPGLIARFGGHAAAAGLTIAEAGYGEFAGAFAQAVEELLPPDARTQRIETDGSLAPEQRTLQVAELLEGGIWGQGFPQPLFCDNFTVESQRVVGEKHLKLRLLKDGRKLEAMRFGSAEPLPSSVRAAYRLAVNEFNGMKTVQLNLEHFE